MRDVVALTDRLKADLPRMLDEHKAIVAALEELARAAEADGHPEALRFAEKLTLHAQNEEEVLRIPSTDIPRGRAERQTRWPRAAESWPRCGALHLDWSGPDA
jgi:hypothetical protein